MTDTGSSEFGIRLDLLRRNLAGLRDAASSNYNGTRDISLRRVYLAEAGAYKTALGLVETCLGNLEKKD